MALLLLFAVSILSTGANLQCGINISVIPIEANKGIGFMDFQETIEISFDLQINSDNCSQYHDWCHIFNIHDRLPLLYIQTLTANQFVAEFLPPDWDSKVSDKLPPQIVSTMMDGEYHHFDLQYTPTERIIAFDYVTYVNVTDADNHISQVNTREIYAVNVDNNQFVVDGNIKNLCIRTRWITADPTSNPTSQPTQYPSQNPTMTTQTPSDFPTQIPSNIPTTISFSKPHDDH
eukprot:1085703_1